MFCSTTIDCCANGRCFSKSTLASKSKWLDFITGLVILTFGLLMICGILHAYATVAWFVTGFGACYVGMIVYRILADLKLASKICQDVYVL